MNNDKAILTLVNSVVINGRLISAGTWISLPIEALKTAFEDVPSFKDKIITKLTGKQRGRPRKKDINETMITQSE